MHAHRATAAAEQASSGQFVELHRHPMQSSPATTKWLNARLYYSGLACHSARAGPENKALEVGGPTGVVAHVHFRQLQACGVTKRITYSLGISFGRCDDYASTVEQSSSCMCVT